MTIRRASVILAALLITGICIWRFGTSDAGTSKKSEGHYCARTLCGSPHQPEKMYRTGLARTRLYLINIAVFADEILLLARR